MNKKILAMLMTLCFTSTTFASFKQTIRVCLTTTLDNVQASFTSTDIFDSGTDLGVSGCGQHTYQHGPKNIILQINASPKEIFRFDPSCWYMRAYYTCEHGFCWQRLVSDKLRTGSANEFWQLNLSQTGIEQGKAVYTLSCQHRAD